MLRHINGEDGDEEQLAQLALRMQEDCGLSSVTGEQQDAHEAFLKLLEALQGCLCPSEGPQKGPRRRGRRQLEAFRASRKLWRLQPSCVAACRALQDFQELFEGILKETRTCCACGLVRVESLP